MAAHKLFALTVVLSIAWLAAGCPTSEITGFVYPDLRDVPDVGPLPDVTDTVEPVACADDSECPDGRCNPDTHTCVGCLTAADCGAGEACIEWECVQLPECKADGDCPAGTVCDEPNHVCVECVEDADCPAGTCAANECLLPCEVGCPAGLVCDEVSNVCVECLADGDCKAEEWCNVEAGTCFGDQCVPGTLGCVGAAAAVCADNGSGWTGLEECPAGTLCVDGVCLEVVCVPGLKSCKDETTVQVCRADGMGFDLVPCKDNELCANGACKQGCVPDCDGKQCGDSGCPGYSCGTCAQGQYCGADFLCHSGVCQPGSTTCQAGGVVTCNGSGTGWSAPKACPPGTSCEDGKCAGCQPSCVNADGTLKQCGDDGCGGLCGACPAGTSCVSGKCQGCTPLCAGKQCGSDGCGGSCGECKPTAKCDETSGQCVVICTPSCAGKQCGGDGCGGSCGECKPGDKCNDQGQCKPPCTPSCGGKDCGPDGCGSNCGVCPAGATCDSWGICEIICEPDCWDKKCGSDGCGGSCGLCLKGYACVSGLCEVSLSCKEMLQCFWSCPEWDDECSSGCWLDGLPEAKAQFQDILFCIQDICGSDASDDCSGQAIAGPCKKQWDACQSCTPACTGKQCGEDGCGGTCGTCPTGFACDPFGGCLCTPQCAGKECGPDGCGGSCGTCPIGICNVKGKCVCVPQCAGKECGPDGCGGSCGTCPAGVECSDAGTCAPKSCGNGKCQKGKGETCENCPQDCGPCPGCGDWVCDWAVESCETCPEDCGECGWEDCCLSHESTGCWDPWVTSCVCGMDPYCCEVMWDSICVGEASQQCGAYCPSVCGDWMCDPEWESCESCPQDCGNCGTGDCCYTHDYAGCQDPWVTGCVCQQYPFCCDMMWADICVDFALQCGAQCNGGCGDGWCDYYSEDCWSCPWDCGECAYCGDGWCDYYSEDCQWCPEDCGWCGECGDGWCDYYNEDCWSCPWDCGECSYCGDGWCSEGEDCMSCEWDCGSCGNSDCCQPHPYPGCDTDWVTECVCGMAPNCCAYGWDPKCADVAVNMCGFPCEVPCEPSCYTSWGGYKECGDDGCGGVCGWCAKGQECTDDGQCVGGGGLKCADLVNCGLECGFSLECYGECYTQGSPAAKPLFQELTFCVLQACGVNPMPECAKMSLDGECAEQYEKCLMN